MCSIFHNRINYRGPRRNSSNSNSSSGSSLTKEFESDRNNNGVGIDGDTNAITAAKSAIMSVTNGSDEATNITQIELRKPSVSNDDEKDANEVEEVEEVEEVMEEQDERKEKEDSNEALDLSIISNRLPVSGHVALEALQHTKVAVAQFAATALSNSHSYSNAVSDLAMVQSTIFNVQRQHFMQLQLIQHLQSQLKRVNNISADDVKLSEREKEGDETTEKSGMSGQATACETLDKNILQNQENGNLDRVKAVTPTTTVKENKKTEESCAIHESSDVKRNEAEDVENGSLSSTKNITLSFQPLMCDISSTLASSIITNHDPTPPLNEPNCLEVLQRCTEEVLDSASQSMHATQLHDEYEYSQKDAQGRGEIFKHRCKYCGKIFGSYSALQIHLRSHTGERPFHCNVCGSKFTTKGNLKVHYQRHTQIFPPILLPPGVSAPNPEQFIPFPTVNSLMPAASNQKMPIRLPFQSHPCAAKEHSNTDQNVHKYPIENSNDQLKEVETSEAIRPVSDSPEDLSKINLPETESLQKPVEQPKSPKFLKENSTRPPVEKSEEPPNSNTPTIKWNGNLKKRNSISGTPPNESRKSYSFMEDRDSSDHLSKLYRRSSISRNSNNSSLDHIPADFSLAQMEKIIDKSWEDLIEIDKTSETSKLQQLVDNIENKLTDPNQCLFCQKVMSCRSSLQMHIRTHTGERPFRCKICGRAFATKGNLKAHMSIHKIKPPMRSQFKCPVCHQKFSNGIILQQHIRIHTIDEGGCGSLGTAGLNMLGSCSMPALGLNSVGMLSAGVSTGSSETAMAWAEHNSRLKLHVDANVVEDQNSTKSMGASDTFDFSTTSDYSGQRSESSQGDFDDYMTMDSTDESRENSCSVTPLERHIKDDYHEKSDVERDLETDLEREQVQNGEGSNDLLGAMDLSSRGFNVNGSIPKHLAHLAPVFGVPHNFLLMAAGRHEEISEHPKYPLIPFGPLGFMGLQTHGALICNFCMKMFPNSAALESHTQNEHTKDAITNTNRSSCDATSPLNTKLTLNPNLFSKKPKNYDNDNDRSQDPNCIHKDLQLIQETKNIQNSYESDRNSEPLKVDIKQEPNENLDLQQTNSSEYCLHKTPSPQQEQIEQDQHQQQQHHHLQQSVDTIDAEQSLMKMQLLSSLPHESHELHRFPASPLEFQQALMSVGPPNSNLDSSLSNKHFCHICRRNFSSSSALQIHTRTHTGDKPFQCNVCQKAFTTKGNLKVHMGTHMWTNPTSRRGRRMSLELPMHRPGTLPTESDFIPRRHELFFPYLPTFFNGLSPKPSDINTGAFSNIPPTSGQHFPNGSINKYSTGFGLGFAPFLNAPYNITNIPSIESDRHISSESSPTASIDEHGKPLENSKNISEEADWNIQSKIKSENNQNENNQLKENQLEENDNENK